MAVDRHFELDYRVRFDESGADGLLRSSGYLRYAQDLAWVHSEAAGFDRAWYRERGLHWLVRCIELDVLGEADYGDTLRVTTEVVGWRRVWARRESTFHSAGGGPMLARAYIDWVLLDASERPARVPEEISRFFSDGRGFRPAKVDLPDVPPTASEGRFAVRPQDLDPMAHVNNATYLDYFEEALAASAGAEGPAMAALARSPRRYRLEYLRAAQPNDDLVGQLWADEGGWAYLLADRSGSALLRARLVDPSGSVAPTGSATAERGIERTRTAPVAKETT